MRRGLTVLVVLGTFAAVVGTVPGARSWPSAAAVASLMILPAALSASACAWVAWRLSPATGTAWFTAATAMIGVQWPLLLVGDDDEYGGIGLVSSAVVVGLAVLLIVWVAERLQLRVAPVPVGVGIGAVLLLVTIGWARVSLPDGHALQGRYGAGVLVVMGLLVAAALVRSATLPLGVGRLAVSVLFWTWATALEIDAPTSHAAWAALTVVLALTSAVLLAGVGLDLLRLGMGEEMATVHRLERELSTLRDQTRVDVEHLHEVKGTIAGIASASALISGERRLPAQARDRLAEMVTAETARLHRMFDDTTSSGTEAADLDEIIRPLVVAHRVLGHDVVWHPPTTPLRAPADPLAEAVSILLHNAAEHAPGVPVWIYTRAGQACTELVVVDLGPGVPEHQREQIFDWGWRGPDSRGRGVGLAIAADVVADMGGTLRLEQQQRHGATFVIELPEQPGGTADDRGRLDETADVDDPDDDSVEAY